MKKNNSLPAAPKPAAKPAAPITATAIKAAAQVVKTQIESNLSPKPNATPPASVRSALSPIEDYPVRLIRTDTKRFQNRQSEYSEQSVQRIVENFDPNRFDPIRVWHDPKTDKVFVLSGHSRLEAFRRLKLENIPVSYFVGSEAEAIRFAKVDANRSATAETLLEDVRAFMLERDLMRDSVDKLRMKWKERYNKLEAYSYLDAVGKFMIALDKPEGFPFIGNKSMWVGILRKHYPALTNAHESEMFDFLYSPKGASTDKETFTNRVSQIASRLDFDASKKLHLDKQGATGTEARADTAESQRRIYEIEGQLTAYRSRYSTAFTPEEKRSVKAEIARLLAEKERLERGISTVLKTQAALFGTANDRRERIAATHKIAAFIAKWQKQNEGLFNSISENNNAFRKDFSAFMKREGISHDIIQQYKEFLSPTFDGAGKHATGYRQTTTYTVLDGLGVPTRSRAKQAENTGKTVATQEIHAYVERKVLMRDLPQVTSSRAAAEILRKVIGEHNMNLREVFVVLCLNRQNRVIGHYIAHIGGISATIVDAKIVFSVALKMGASAIIVCHNHPSGNTQASEADSSITKKLKSTGAVLEIAVLDHIIVTEDDYNSHADSGLWGLSGVTAKATNKHY